MTAGNNKRKMGAAALAAALAALCFGVLASTAPPDAGARGADCGPYVNSGPGEAKLKQLRKALGCLINAERAERGRKKLRPNGDLTQLAQSHTKVMLAQECFRHKCPGERALRERIETSGYLKGGGRYGYGEDLGCAETPAGMLAAWMSTSFHKKNILDRQFRHFGIGAGRGAPDSSGCEERGYATYTVIFGWRKPPA